MIYLILALAGVFAIRKAQTSAVTPGGPGGVLAFSSPTEGFRPSEVHPVSPQASTTLTDAPDNLFAVAKIYNALQLKNSPAQQQKQGEVQYGYGGVTGSGGSGAGGAGSGGAGGGGGRIGCPLKGTPIVPLGTDQIQVVEMTQHDWVKITAGEFELTASPSHLLITDQGTKTLDEIEPGVKVVTTNGERLVTNKLTFEKPGVKLRIHVPESHLYWAGGILSHNKA